MYQPVTQAELNRTHGPRPAVTAFLNVCLFLFRGRGIKNDGIYNRRRQRGGTAWSLHSTGRAVDLGVTSKQLGDEIAIRCIAAHDALGIGEVIWWDHRWTTERGYQPYHPGPGGDPHHAHVHIGFTIAFADQPATDGLSKWIAQAIINAG